MTAVFLLGLSDATMYVYEVQGHVEVSCGMVTWEFAEAIPQVFNDK